MRGADVFWEVKLSNDSQQAKTIMGDNVLSIHFLNPNYISFAILDYCTVFGERYKLRELPVVKKTGSNHFEYTLKMMAEGHDLANAQYLFLGPDNLLKESEFSLTGNADTFVDLIISNISRIDTGWIKGEVIATDYKNLSFKNESCYDALVRLAEEFDTEFRIEGKTIHLAKRSNDTGYTYQVGYNLGLKEINRVNIDSTKIVTRLYAYGSEKNLPTDYQPLGSRRLHLPPAIVTLNSCLPSDITWTFETSGRSGVFGFYDLRIEWTAPDDPDVTSVEVQYTYPLTGATGSITVLPEGPAIIPRAVFGVTFTIISHGGACEGVTSPTFEARANQPFPQLPAAQRVYVQKNISFFGIIEGTIDFDDIYPHRTGTVTGVDASDPFKFVDTGIDFDLNAFLLPGLTAQVTFMTGQLAGYTLDISTYDDSTKTIVVLKNKNETLLEIPGPVFRPAIGDQYVITNIQLPTSYIEAAEQELLAAAQKYLDTYAQPQYTIQAVMDTKYMKNYLRVVAIGDMIWIKDDQMALDRKIRIIQVTRNLVEEYQFQITLADLVTTGKLASISSRVALNSRATASLGRFTFSRDITNGFLILPPSGVTGLVQVMVDPATGKAYRSP